MGCASYKIKCFRTTRRSTSEPLIFGAFRDPICEGFLYGRAAMPSLSLLPGPPVDPGAHAARASRSAASSTVAGIAGRRRGCIAALVAPRPRLACHRPRRAPRSRLRQPQRRPPDRAPSSTAGSIAALAVQEHARCHQPASLPEVQSTLGHGNIATTSGYLHAGPTRRAPTP